MFIIVAMRSLSRTVRGALRTLGADTARTVAVTCGSVLVIGVSYGATAHDAGLATWQIITIATVVLAGSSEFVLIGVIAGGGAPILGALAGLLVNARHLGYGLSVGPHMGRGMRLLAGAHLLNDESAAMTAAQRDPRRARLTFLACGIGVLITWPLGAWLGSVVGHVVAEPDSLGIDAAFPALLFALAIPALKERRTAVAALLGGVIAFAVAPAAPAGVPVLLALIGVAVAQLVPASASDSEEIVERANDPVSA